MTVKLRRSLLAVVSLGVMLMTGCSGTTTINSDLVLDTDASARIDLHQTTQAVELVNESDVAVRVLVLGKKDRVISRLRLNGQEQARLDLLPARALQFENMGDETAVVHWTLLNDSRIGFSLAMESDTH